MKDGKLFPGQQISVDHFVCSTKGVKPESRDGKNPNNMYSGGCMFVDTASGLVQVKHQVHLNTHETLAAKQEFEEFCRDNGVIPQEYLSDEGSPFTSKAFAEKLAVYATQVPDKTILPAFLSLGGFTEKARQSCEERGIGIAERIACF